MAEKHIVTYPNGATLIYYQQNVNKTTDVTIGFCGGASLDGEKLGLAHALEHSFFLSNDTFKRDEMYDILSQTGTEYNAYTTQDCIADVFNCTSVNLEKVLDMNVKMLLNKNINKLEFAREKKVIMQELYMTLDNEQHTFLDDINVSKDYKKGKDILGNIHTLSKITVDDLVDYKNKYFTTNNMVVSVVSDLPFEQIKPLFEKNLIEKFPTNNQTKVKLSARKYRFKNKEYMVDIPDKNSFMIYLVFKGLKNAEKNELYTRFEEWYFNNFSGALLKKLRLEKPYVYTAGFSNIKLVNHNLKNFGILTSPKNVNKCIEQITSVLKNAIENGVSEEEFEKFKQTVIAERDRKTNIKNHSSSDLFNNYIYGEKPFVKKFYQKLLNLSREEINNYLRETYGNGELIIDYVGDIAKAENRFDLTKYPGYNVFSDEYVNKLAMEALEKETPIYTLQEVLNQFSLKYKKEDAEIPVDGSVGLLVVFINIANNKALNLRNLLNNPKLKTNSKLIADVAKANTYLNNNSQDLDLVKTLEYKK